MLTSKLKSINGVYFGKSKLKKTPYIRILCKDAEARSCSWTGWLTTDNAENVKDMLSHFKINGSIEEVISASPSDRISFFSLPSEEVFIEESEYNGKTYRQIQCMAKDKKELEDGMTKDEVREAWKKFDFQAQDITELNTQDQVDDDDDPPF